MPKTPIRTPLTVICLTHLDNMMYEGVDGVGEEGGCAAE